MPNPIGAIGASQTTQQQPALRAIAAASRATGVDFDYLVTKAKQESGLNAAAQAATSSARGLFQFIEQTWLQMVKEHGSKYGLDELAAGIETGPNGRLRVSDRADQQKILSLRDDAFLNASMAAELTRENQAYLQNKLGGKIGRTELYLAHFMGAGGSEDFLRAMRQNPQAEAATLFPTAAAANRAVFFDKAGEPRSLQEIYSRFARQHDDKPLSVAQAAASAVTAPTTPQAAQPQLGWQLAQLQENVQAWTPTNSTQQMSAAPAASQQPLDANSAAVLAQLQGQEQASFVTMLLAQLQVPDSGARAAQNNRAA